MRKTILAVAAASLVSACAGRDPAPMMPIAMPTDQALNCQAIYAEMTANNTRIASLSKEESNTTAGNVALGVAGAILFWPALFAMDFKNAAGKDRAQVEARQTYLTTVYTQKNCTAEVAGGPVAGWR